MWYVFLQRFFTYGMCLFLQRFFTYGMYFYNVFFLRGNFEVTPQNFTYVFLHMYFYSVLFT